MGIPQQRRLSTRFFALRRRVWDANPADVADRIPVNSSVPVITGTGTVGQTLSASTGAWVRARPGAFTYQWERAGTPISGATSSTYTIVPADSGTNLTVVVTAYNMAGAAVAESTTKAVA